MLHHEAVGRTALHDPPPQERVEAGLASTDHRLPDRGGMTFPQLVVDQLGYVTVAVNANLPHLSHRLEDRTGLLDVGLLAADEHGHVTADSRIDGSGDGGIDRFAAPEDEFLDELAHEGRG